ncbi:unnamed protein product [Ostreobium quekettii]|uniref:UBC core domain-containing protein n=1 Tax=Ostreobium quekettii TaxID=121088 RepID=A0A8S1JE79_9CHLO|nr:unnamed protein product [Ostreobium quekettii]|eukprot:evm.model.scf_89.27 EVM.evm.TU.scf_89.27   scf_89:154152-156311(-)
MPLRTELLIWGGLPIGVAAITSLALKAAERIHLHFALRAAQEGPRRPRLRLPAPAPTYDEDSRYVDEFRGQQVMTAVLAISHHFCKNGTRDEARKRKAASIAHISREIQALHTSLPLHWESSVFLAVDEGHMDIMRALIIPGGATPYANGCFVFDVYLPPDYPQVPPKVHFMTTGAGNVRFNPNLYSDGRVCLSLLGTWDGPSWKPGSSTLLQVLVSIQSMIFTEEPYWNEPRHGDRRGRRRDENQSWLYTLISRYHTLVHAIKPVIRHPPHPFENVCHTHLRLKQQAIRQQCDDWLREAKGWKYEPQMAHAVEKVKTMLRYL